MLRDWYTILIVPLHLYGKIYVCTCICTHAQGAHAYNNTSEFRMGINNKLSRLFLGSMRARQSKRERGRIE